MNPCDLIAMALDTEVFPPVRAGAEAGDRGEGREKARGRSLYVFTSQ